MTESLCVLNPKYDVCPETKDATVSGEGTDGRWSFSVDDMMQWGGDGAGGSVDIDFSQDGSWAYFEVACHAVEDKVLHFNMPTRQIEDMLRRCYVLREDRMKGE